MTRVTVIPILTPENVWQAFQEEAEEIVAPGGKLIADPIQRNRRINAAYAALWLHDPRFQWAGLAAFASKQVGCGLLHAADTAANFRKANRNASGSVGMELATHALEPQYRYVHDMLALGNTTLFLDFFPLHAFYKKRGLVELKKYLEFRKNIRYYSKNYHLLWPVGHETLAFGLGRAEILQAFEAIDSGKITDSVRFLAHHEQMNILQPTLYNNTRFQLLLRANQAAYVTGLPSGLVEAVELTLAGQCQRLPDGRTIGFSDGATADLSDAQQRMQFVLRAATRFDQLLHGPQRVLIEHSLREIAAGHGVR